MTADTDKIESIHDLFAAPTVKSAETEIAPEPEKSSGEAAVTADEEKENIREHVRLGVRLSGSAAKFAKLVGTSGVTVCNWLSKYYPREHFYEPIASALGVSVGDLFQRPSAELIARSEEAPGMRSNLRNGAALFGEAAAGKDSLKRLAESADSLAAGNDFSGIPSSPARPVEFTVPAEAIEDLSVAEDVPAAPADTLEEPAPAVADSMPAETAVTEAPSQAEALATDAPAAQEDVRRSQTESDIPAPAEEI